MELILGRTVVLYRTKTCKRLITVDKVWRGERWKSLISRWLLRAFKAGARGRLQRPSYLILAASVCYESVGIETRRSFCVLILC